MRVFTRMAFAPSKEAMSLPEQSSHAHHEADVSQAISDHPSGKHTSLRQAADAFSIPCTTRQRRMAGSISRSYAHTYQQILSTAEERALVRWIARLKTTGSPASPALIVEMAEEIRRGRLKLAKGSDPSPGGPEYMD